MTNDLMVEGAGGSSLGYNQFIDTSVVRYDRLYAIGMIAAGIFSVAVVFLKHNGVSFKKNKIVKSVTKTISNPTTILSSLYIAYNTGIFFHALKHKPLINIGGFASLAALVTHSFHSIKGVENQEDGKKSKLLKSLEVTSIALSSLVLTHTAASTVFKVVSLSTIIFTSSLLSLAAFSGIMKYSSNIISAFKKEDSLSLDIAIGTMLLAAYFTYPILLPVVSVLYFARMAKILKDAYPEIKKKLPNHIYAKILDFLIEKFKEKPLKISLPILTGCYALKRYLGLDSEHVDDVDEIVEGRKHLISRNEDTNVVARIEEGDEEEDEGEEEEITEVYSVRGWLNNRRGYAIRFIGGFEEEEEIEESSSDISASKVLETVIQSGANIRCKKLSQDDVIRRLEEFVNISSTSAKPVVGGRIKKKKSMLRLFGRDTYRSFLDVFDIFNQACSYEIDAGLICQAFCAVVNWSVDSYNDSFLKWLYVQSIVERLGVFLGNDSQVALTFSKNKDVLTSLRRFDAKQNEKITKEALEQVLAQLALIDSGDAIKLSVTEKSIKRDEVENYDFRTRFVSLLSLQTVKRCCTRDGRAELKEKFNNYVDNLNPEEFSFLFSRMLAQGSHENTDLLIEVFKRAADMRGFNDDLIKLAYRGLTILRDSYSKEHNNKNRAFFHIEKILGTIRTKLEERDIFVLEEQKLFTQPSNRKPVTEEIEEEEEIFNDQLPDDEKQEWGFVSQKFVNNPEWQEINETKPEDVEYEKYIKVSCERKMGRLSKGNIPSPNNVFGKNKITENAELINYFRQSVQIEVEKKLVLFGFKGLLKELNKKNNLFLREEWRSIILHSKAVLMQNGYEEDDFKDFVDLKNIEGNNGAYLQKDDIKCMFVELAKIETGKKPRFIFDDFSVRVENASDGLHMQAKRGFISKMKHKVSSVVSTSESSSVVRKLILVKGAVYLAARCRNFNKALVKPAYDGLLRLRDSHNPGSTERIRLNLILKDMINAFKDQIEDKDI